MPAHPPSLSIAFVASEVAPFAKSGGLADVAGALPRELHKLGHDVRVFMPLYSNIQHSTLGLVPVAAVTDVVVALGALDYRFSLLVGKLPYSEVPTYFVNCPALFHRPSMYTSDHDEHLRFLLLQRAVLESCQRLRFAPNILHCNDWHTALLPLLLKSVYAWDKLFAQTRSLLSIHNIGYQGHFSSSTLGHMHLGKNAALLDSNELAHGRINWLKEGVRHADRVSTVSPTYASEITTPLGGHGLDTALLARGDTIVGILNGVDYDEWNPATDTHLPVRYSATDLSGKAQVKAELIKRMNLQITPTTPMIGIVSRLTLQKGFDLLFDALPTLLRQRDVAFTIIGSGEPRYEKFFAELAAQFPDRVAFHNGYSEELAHWIEAGSDLFLMPSMYEPCGLNQMYSLKYGTIPIVRHTGGLADSVHMWNAETQTGNGVVFNDFDATGVTWALHTALDLYKSPNAWQRITQNAMASDYSWQQQVVEYQSLYYSMLL
jgi:starch synthase